MNTTEKKRPKSSLYEVISSIRLIYGVDQYDRVLEEQEARDLLELISNFLKKKPKESD